MPASEKHRLAMTPEGQRNHDLALSLSKGGPRAPSVLRLAQHGVGELGRRTAPSVALGGFFGRHPPEPSRAHRHRPYERLVATMSGKRTPTTVSHSIWFATYCLGRDWECSR